MGRSQTTGLSYYNTVTDIFQNRKIRRLIKTFDAKGYLIYSYLKTEIYRDKGYFLEWDENTAFDVSDAINQKESLIIEVVNFCCTTGLFNKDLFTNENVLTTKNIQEFWVNVSKKAKRKCCDVEVRYSLIKEEKPPNKEEKQVNREEKTLNEEESTQSKVKKRKVNNNINEVDEILNSFKKHIGGYESDSWRDSFYMKLKYKKGCLSKILDEFIIDFKLREHSKPKNLKEFKEHLLNWVNVQDRLNKFDKYKVKSNKSLSI